MTPTIVDTNVAVVAEGLADHADTACVSVCSVRLEQLVTHGVLLVDELGEIVLEYLQALGHSGQPGVGRAFAKWAYDNQHIEYKIKRVKTTPLAAGTTRRFAEFPDTAELSAFDPTDQKFAAVAIASRINPVILNAVDSDWWDARAGLQAAGVRVEFLCPQHMPS